MKTIKNQKKKKPPGLKKLAAKGAVVAIIASIFVLSRLFSIEPQPKPAGVSGEEKSKELLETEAILDARIQAVALRIQEMMILKELPEIRIAPTRTQIELTNNPNCINYDSFSFGDSVERAGLPSNGYYLKNVKLCFKEAKLLGIESTFTESSMKHGERDQIKIVYADPTANHPDSLLVESSFHMSGKRTVKLGEMENSKLRGHRLVFKRDCYLPHLSDLEYHLRVTYDMHKNTATHRNRDTVNFLKKRAMK